MAPTVSVMASVPMLLPTSRTRSLSSSAATGSGWLKGKEFGRIQTVSPSASLSVVSMARENDVSVETVTTSSRRILALGVLSAGAFLGNGGVATKEARAVSSSRRALRSEQIPESEYKSLPSGLKIYDIKIGGGPEAVKGSRVAVHYVAKWKGITFMTSRQGAGVTGGTPYGFDVGGSERAMVLKGLDEGVQGMRVGGQRMLIVPPELAYGNKGIQEIPPGATLEFNVELLSIKKEAFR